MPKVKCIACGKKIYKAPSKVRKAVGYGIHCSMVCYNRSRISRVNLTCGECDKTFSRNRSAMKKSKRHYCSQDCFYSSGREVLVCPICGERFSAKKSGNRKVCSRKCVGEYQKGANNPRWRGGKRKQGGYVYVLRPEHPFSAKNGYIAEHRIVMEKKLDRYLHPDEVVDHINHDKADNRPENLRVFSSHSKHMKEDMDIVRFVKKNFGSLKSLKKALK